MKSLAELKAIKEKMQNQISGRDGVGEQDTRIVVGMATCGIAAGARPVLNTLVEEVANRKLAHVKVTQAGCIGMCRLEPIVEVFVPNQPKVTYVKVDSQIAKKIVSEHIVNGNPVKENIITK